MKNKYCLLFLLLLSLSTYLAKAQQVDATYLNPKSGSIDTYKYVRFGTPTEFWGGFMINHSNNGFGNGDDFVMFTYDNRDISIRGGLGHVLLNPDGGGFIGIGTKVPQTNLHVVGVARFMRAGGGSNYLDISSDSNGSFIESNDGGVNQKHLYFRVAPTGDNMMDRHMFFQAGKSSGTYQTRMMIHGNGNVGIGTTSPSEALHVKGKLYLDFVDQTTEGWKHSYLSYPGHSLVIGTPDGISRTVLIDLKPGGVNGLETSSMLRLQQKKSTDESEVTVWFRSAGDSYFNGGNVGIGTTSPDELLSVNGTVHAKEVRVDLDFPGPDYVFEESYPLMSLEETEKYIQANKHLPEVPSAKEMEQNGVKLLEMNMLLLKKVEELTLHAIGQQKEIETLKKMVNELNEKNQNKN